MANDEAAAQTPVTLAAVRDISRMRKAPAGARGPGGKVMSDLVIWEQFQRVGGQLSPIQVSQIMRQADTGNCRQLMDLANDARQKDCHLSAVLSQSEESLAGLEWKLALPEKSKKKERDATEWCDTYLRRKIAEPFASLIAHLAGGPFYGFAVSETEWIKDEKKRLVPINFDNQSQRRFKFRKSDGKLVWYDTGMPDEGVDFREEFPNRFVVAQPRVTGDVAPREGLVRVLMWAALFRSWSMTDWLRTGEIAWKPWRIGTYQKGATEEDIDGLITILDQLASTGTAALPATASIDIKWPGGQGGGKPTHSELFNVIAQEMSKAVLGQTETTQASTSSGYAQAMVHLAVRENILRARARHIAAVITRDVIRPMFEMNFGRGFAQPMFQFITKDNVDLKNFSEGITNLTKKSNLRVGAKWIRETAGIPEPEEGEESLGGLEIVPEVGANGQLKEPTKPKPAGAEGKPASPTPAAGAAETADEQDGEA